MKSVRLSIIVLAAVCQTAPAALAEGTGGRSCPQALAAYGTSDQRMQLEFSGSPDMSFVLLIEGTDAKFDGYTYPAEDEGGIAGVVLNGCPEGDVTGEELAACTLWQGPVRAIGSDGKVFDLPASDQPAAGFLRLDGLAAALLARMPDLVAGLPQEEIEKLTLSACQE